MTINKENENQCYPFQEEVHIFCFGIDDQIIDLLVLDIPQNAFVSLRRGLT